MNAFEWNENRNRKYKHRKEEEEEEEEEREYELNAAIHSLARKMYTAHNEMHVCVCALFTIWYSTHCIPIDAFYENTRWN